MILVLDYLAIKLYTKDKLKKRGNKMNATQLTNGTKIITTYGNVYTVMRVWDNMVYVYEGQGMVHISKVSRIVSK